MSGPTCLSHAHKRCVLQLIMFSLFLIFPHYFQRGRQRPTTCIPPNIQTLPLPVTGRTHSTGNAESVRRTPQCGRSKVTWRFPHPTTGRAERGVGFLPWFPPARHENLVFSKGYSCSDEEVASQRYLRHPTAVGAEAEEQQRARRQKKESNGAGPFLCPVGCGVRATRWL